MPLQPLHFYDEPIEVLGAPIPARLFRLVGVPDGTAVGADRTFRPTQAFKPFTGGFMALEMRGDKGVGHGQFPLNLRKH
jgi:hypothetical protein